MFSRGDMLKAAAQVTKDAARGTMAALLRCVALSARNARKAAFFRGGSVSDAAKSGSARENAEPGGAQASAFVRKKEAAS